MALVSACHEQKPKDSPAPPPSATNGASEAPRATQAHIPVGKFRAGSRPGEAARDPATEPLEKTLELGPYRIDSHLARDDAGELLLGKTLAEAEAVCASKSARLCTDLEWQRACRGPESHVYPGASDRPRAQSGFDVFEMGTRPEWTRSVFGAGSAHQNAHVLTGAPVGAPEPERRCARRLPEKSVEVKDAGFRCCHGAPNALTLSEPTLGPAFELVTLQNDELRALLADNPRTQGLAKEATLFKPDAADTVLARGPGESQGFTLTTSALLWSPAAGVRYLLVTAKSGDKTSFVLAFEATGEKKTLAGSFLMKNESGPIALAYAPSIRPRVHFSTCFGCPGETGKVLFREPEELVFLQP